MSDIREVNASWAQVAVSAADVSQALHAMRVALIMNKRIPDRLLTQEDKRQIEDLLTKARHALVDVENHLECAERVYVCRMAELQREAGGRKGGR